MRKTRKVLAAVLAMALVLALMPTAAFAAADVWDGATGISWYDGSNPQTSYEITTAAQLAGLAQLVNGGTAFSGTTFVLAADIDLDNREWTPIGKGYIDWNTSEVSFGFEGTFDGGGHSVSGLSVTVNSATSNDGYILGGAALFGYLIEGTVKNIKVYGTVNVQEYGSSDSHMGNNAGIVGFNAAGTIENCINYATITGHYTGGGIVGYNDSGTIIKCTNYGSISRTGGAGTCTGGIAGLSVGNISLCHNAGAVSYSGSNGYGYVGGIVGSGESGYPSAISSCYNSGAVSNNYSKHCGGIIGGAYDVSIADCYNSGMVTNAAAADQCGAIGGDVGSGSTATNNYYLDTSCGRGYAAGATDGATAKTSDELKSREVLDALNQTDTAWGVADGTDYPVFLFTIPADYSAVDAAIEAVPADLDVYTDATVQALQAALDAVVLGKMADEQSVVDGYAAAIVSATSALAMLPAPTVTDITPVGTDNARSGSVVIVFSEAMDKNITGTVQLNSLAALETGAWTNGNKTYTAAYSGLAYNTEYAINISGFKSAQGIEMTADTSNKFTTEAAPAILSVGAQRGTLTAGTAGSATFTVTTENIANNSEITLNNINSVAGITLVPVNTTGNSTNITISTTTATPRGSHPLTLTIDGVTSAGFNLTVDAAPSSGGGGYTPATYSVKFNANGGSAVSTQRVEQNLRAVRPTDPTREGFTFAGWYSDEALTQEFDFTTRINGNLTLYAGWKEISEPEPWDNPFLDVFESDWFYGDVRYVHENGLMNGTAPDLFSPQMSITRGMIVTILYRYAGEPDVSGQGNPFTDVPDSQYYANAVKWAAENRIVEGYDGRYSPDANITRQDLAVIFERFIGFAGYEYAVTDEYRFFTDEEAISGYAKNAIQLLNKLGIINGTNINADGQATIDPQGQATRAEAAAMLHRFVDMIEE